LKALNVSPENLRFRALIGVGGIGSGSFFALQGNETLGREESRLGHFLDRRDYCKLHIIAHYVATLVGQGFLTLPVGRVGNDETGRRLLNEMSEAGLDTRFVQTAPGHPTLYSFCFVYPDGSGGNLTTDDSACSTIGPSDLAEVEGEFERFRGSGIALAAPEVPLAVRARLLELGRKHRFFNVATFSSEDIRAALEKGLVGHLDLLALNRHEAATLANLQSEESPAETIAKSAAATLESRYPQLLLSITTGREGSWICEDSRLTHRPAVPADVCSTAGAGDAHLAGLVVGLSAGLSFEQSHELASLLASFTVTSPHTIHPDAHRDTLRDFALHGGVSLSKEVSKLLYADH
jgi:ribokinase